MRMSVTQPLRAALMLLTIVLPAHAIDVVNTKMLTQPATSAAHVAFVYAGDIWVAGHDGTGVRRLTSDTGSESSPAFSPDGRLVAFTGEYEGNQDVYVVPVEGGIPTRLTWHPGADTVRGFTPDGKAVTFVSARAAFNNRYSHLFTVPVNGGLEQQLPIPSVTRASYSPDGTRIAYNPLADQFTQWKRYRGGGVSQLWLYTVSNHHVDKVPQPEGRSNDVDPMWIGETLYFRSDRGGEFNIYAFDTKTKAVRQITRHDDFPVMNASSGGGKIVYEQAGTLHLLEPRAGESTPLKIGVAADLPEMRPRFVKGAKWIRDVSLSPSAARVAFEFRGEIVTVPAEKGDPRNLTGTTAVHERSPAWSSDGKQIAYFSDEGGEYQLHVRAQDGKGEARRYRLDGAGFYDQPAWSPDSQKVAFIDNSQSVSLIDLKTGAVRKIQSQPVYSPIGELRHTWSPDSKWLVYAMDTRAQIQTVYAYSVEQNKSFPITDGLSDAGEPVFDPSGKYLYLFASTDAGPSRDWFSQSNADMRRTRSIYIVVLRKDLPSPLAKETDEEKGTAGSDEKPASEKADKDNAPKAGAQAEAPKPDAPKPDASKNEPFSIDFDGIQFRILDLPVPAADYSSLRVGAAGQVYFLKTVDGKTSLQRFELSTRKTETIVPEASDFRLSSDGKKLLYANNNSWSIVSTTSKIDPAQGRMNVDAIEVRVEPRAEWEQMFHEAWRINRDYFYDPGMHGVDWPAARAKYAAFLPHVATRADLNRLFNWLFSELSVGHHRVAGGDTATPPRAVPGGLLGADYAVENGRYRFKKVYGGLNWTPELRAPLTEPGVNVRAGEYLLAVNGRDVRPTSNLYSFFENTANKIIEITVGPNADGAGSRTVPVVPVATEAALRNRDWVEGNLRKVDAATGGRVAYVYVPNTAQLGHTYFKRYFYPQSQKDAIIVDERFNGGGQVADYYIDLLRRPLVSYWATRYGSDLRTPTAAIMGPKAMIIDETAGSGGDLLPWMFRKFEIGPIIGQRTWGGLVGILGTPVLMDGGVVTAPNLAIWTEQGWVVENEGVPPDIAIEQTPADVIAGRDPQLEKAIEVVMEALKKNPTPDPKRPAYPDKTRRSTTTTSPRGR